MLINPLLSKKRTVWTISLVLVCCLLFSARAFAQKRVTVNGLQPLPVKTLRITADRAERPIWKKSGEALTGQSELPYYRYISRQSDLDLMVAMQEIEANNPRKSLKEAVKNWYESVKITPDEDFQYRPIEEEDQGEGMGTIIVARAEIARSDKTSYVYCAIVATAQKPRRYRLYTCEARASDFSTQEDGKNFIDSLVPQFDPVLIQFKAKPQENLLLCAAELWINGVSVGRPEDPHELPMQTSVTKVSLALKTSEGTIYERENLLLKAGQTFPEAPVSLNPPPITGEITLIATPVEAQITIEGEGKMKRTLKPGETLTYTYPGDASTKLTHVRVQKEGYNDQELLIEMSRGKRTLRLPALQPLPPKPKPASIPTPFTKPGSFSLTFPNKPRTEREGLLSTQEEEGSLYSLHERPLTPEEQGKSHQGVLEGIVLKNGLKLLADSESINEAGHFSSLIGTDSTVERCQFYRYIIAEDTLYTLQVERQGKPEIDETTQKFFGSFKPVIVPGQTKFLEAKEGKYWFPIRAETPETKLAESLKITLPASTRTVELSSRRRVEANAVGFYRLCCVSYEIPASVSKLSQEDLLARCAASIAGGKVITENRAGYPSRKPEFLFVLPKSDSDAPMQTRYRLLINAKKTRLYVLSAQTRPEESDACAVRLFLFQFETE